MKKTALIMTAMFLSVAQPSLAMHKAPTSIYGEHCGNPYGFKRNSMSLLHSINSLRAFFGRKGLEVRMLGHNGRFIKAAIYRSADQVDTIIMDVKTGKMRSIH
jgi:hypothetical protein